MPRVRRLPGARSRTETSRQFGKLTRQTERQKSALLDLLLCSPPQVKRRRNANAERRKKLEENEADADEKGRRATEGKVMIEIESKGGRSLPQKVLLIDIFLFKIGVTSLCLPSVKNV